MSYLILKHLHIGCVVLSGAGFLLRGLWMLGRLAALQRPQRTCPAAHRRYHPARQRDRHGGDQRSVSLRGRLVDRQAGWPAALHRLWHDGLKRGRSKPQRALSCFAALLSFAYIVSVALTPQRARPSPAYRLNASTSHLRTASAALVGHQLAQTGGVEDADLALMHGQAGLLPGSAKRHG
jgi:hypothetical protein